MAIFSCRPCGVWWSWWQWESEEETKDRQKKSNYSGNIFLFSFCVAFLFLLFLRSGGRKDSPLFPPGIIGAFASYIFHQKMVYLVYLPRTMIMWFVTRPHLWRCLVTRKLSPVCCGWIKARCAVRAGITPLEFGTSRLGLTNRRWYVCAVTIFDLLMIKFHLYWSCWGFLRDWKCAPLSARSHAFLVLPKRQDNSLDTQARRYFSCFGLF